VTLSDFDGGFDGLRLCARCRDQDTPDEICSSCKRELVAHYDGEIGWREAWQREQDERVAKAQPLIVFQIAQKGDRLFVELAAASEMRFEVLIQGDYDKLIADICQIAPVMMRYDVDMTEAFDDAFRTQPKAEDRRAISFFVRKYRERIKNASSVGFGEFAELEKN
jgi:hypothetical protein